jgi:hypothetical protein
MDMEYVVQSFFKAVRTIAMVVLIETHGILKVVKNLQKNYKTNL